MANCPINEQTGDAVVVGRCNHYVGLDCICPRHGDVQVEIERFEVDGKLTLENEWRQRVGKPLLAAGI